MKIEIVEYNLHTVAHIGSGFDSFIVSNNSPQLRSVVNLIKNGGGIVSLEIFNGYVDEKKRIPQNVRFRCGRVLIIIGFKKVGINFKLLPS